MRKFCYKTSKFRDSHGGESTNKVVKLGEKSKNYRCGNRGREEQRGGRHGRAHLYWQQLGTQDLSEQDLP